MRKRKRKIRVAIIAGISTIVVATFCIVSFLGRFVGTFTVNLDTGNVKLALFDSHKFENPSSYLRVSELPAFHEYTYSRFDDNHAVVDNDATDYLHGAVYKMDNKTVDSINYFKFTFYVNNIGEIPASYRMSINIIDSKPSDDGRYLDDTLRVMVYDNESSDTHNHTVYAKKSATRHIDPETGEPHFREPISVSEYDATPNNPFRGYAEEFESSSVITTIPVQDFNVGDHKRYTIVMWLEGEDPQSANYRNAPVSAKIKIGVEINAYEN